MELSFELAKTILKTVDGIVITNARGEYQYVNETWIARSGLTLNDVLGKHPWDIYLNSRAKEVIHSHKPIFGHLMKSNRNSGLFMSNYYPLFDGDGNFSGVLIWSLHSGMTAVEELMKMVDSFSKTLSKKQIELTNMERACYNISGIIGSSPLIEQLRQSIRDAARTNSNVLIEGETGTGKELVAHAIHDMSGRHDQRFVRVNCAAIPPELMESEFFGYDDGAFTGARKGGKEGKFEAANHGSLFLDEINQLSYTIQPKFLRVLQEHEVERVGGRKPISVDTRIIAATNVPLESLVSANEFRKDLYYRLNVIRIIVPPLRQRREDIPALCQHLISRLNHQLNLSISGFEDSALSLLMEYDWPGNVRELQNSLEVAMNRCHDDVLRTEHFLPFFEQIERARRPTPKAAPTGVNSLPRQREALERTAIIQAHKASHGNKSAACSALGISRTTFYKRLEKYGLTDIYSFLR